MNATNRVRIDALQNDTAATVATGEQVSVVTDRTNERLERVKKSCPGHSVAPTAGICGACVRTSTGISASDRVPTPARRSSGESVSDDRKLHPPASMAKRFTAVVLSDDSPAARRTTSSGSSKGQIAMTWAYVVYNWHGLRTQWWLLISAILVLVTAKVQDRVEVAVADYELAGQDLGK